MNKLNRLYKETFLFNKSDNLFAAVPERGYFPEDGKEVEEYIEYSAILTQLMKKYNIGTKISKSYWGDRKATEIKKILAKNLIEVPSETGPLVSPKSTNPLNVYDDLRTVSGQDFSNSDFARIARTETANAKSVFSLLKFKELGAKYVIHTTKNDSRVSPQCKLLNNREIEIEHLLSSAGEKDRIAVHPNCRCFYRLSTRLD